jgi:hypothetical protein
MKMIRRFALASGLLIASAAFTPSASAGTQTANGSVPVTLQTNNSCAISSTGITFPTQNVTSSSATTTTINATGTVTVLCGSYGTGITVSLTSANPGTGNPFQLKDNSTGGTATIPYTLYNGDPSTSGTPLTLSGNTASLPGFTTTNGSTPVTIGAKISSGNSITAGITYSDTVSATFNY